MRARVQHQAVTRAGRRAGPRSCGSGPGESGTELAEGDAVADGVHLAGGHAALDQVGAEPVADHDHRVGRRVGGQFQPFQQADHPAVGQHAEFDEDRRPQVADLDDQPGALEPGEQPAGADGEERGRGDDHDVGRPLARQPSSTLVTMKLRWQMVLRSIPSFGVAYSQVRSTR